MAFDGKQFMIGTLIFSIIIIASVTALFYTGQQTSVGIVGANNTFSPIILQANQIIADSNSTANTMRGFVDNNQVSSLGALNDMINGAYSILKTLTGSIKLVTQVLSITVLTIPIPGYIIATAITAFIFTLILWIVYLVFIRVRPQ